ncbi:MAG: hypothetical protein J6X55_12015 [Victivallales bacterium]|nr:hypothetical protein [Victivallales bacterium]
MWHIILTICHWCGLLVTRVAIPFGVLLLAVDLYFEWFGIPEGWCRKIQERIQTKELSVSFDKIQCGLFRGIVLHNTKCTTVTPAGNVRVVAEHIIVYLDLDDLVNLEFFPQALGVDRGSVELMNSEGKKASLNLSDLALKCSLTVDERLVANGKCTGFGLPLELSVGFTDGRRTLKKLLKEKSPEPTVIDKELQEKVSRIVEQLQKLSLPADGSSRMKVTLNGPMEKLGKWKYKGFIHLRGARWDGLQIPYCSTVFHGNTQIFSVDDIQLWLGRADSLSGDADLFIGDREFQAHCSGKLTRSSLEYLVNSVRTVIYDKEMAVSLNELPWNDMSFKAECKRSAMTLEDLDASVRCDFSEADYGVIGRGSAYISASLQKSVLKVDKAEVLLSSVQREGVSFEGNWNLKTGLAEAALDGKMNIRRRLSELGVSLPVSLVSLSDAPCEIMMTLAIENGNLNEMSLAGKMVQPGGQLLGVDCSKVILPFKYEQSEGKVFVDRLLVVRSSKGDMDDETEDERNAVMGLKASCDIMSAIKKNEVDVDIMLDLKGREDEQGPWEMALTYGGHITWKSQGNILSFKGEGTMFPERVYREYLRRYDIDESNMLMHIDCSAGQPAAFSLDFPETSLNDGKRWTLTGNLSFGKVCFNGLDAEKVTCDNFTINSNDCMFKNIHLLTNDDDATFDLHVVYSPLTLTFSNSWLDGKPEIIGKFFPDNIVGGFYSNIFKDITWNKGIRPHIQMPKLVYTYGDHQWRVFCDGIYANVHDIRYRDLKIDEATVIVSLDLPSSVSLEPVNIRFNDKAWGGVRGKVELQLLGTKQCRFQVYDTLMGVDIKKALEGVLPELSEKISDLSISEDCILSCTGSLFLDGEPRLHIEGTLKAKEISYRDFSLQNVIMGWSYDDGDIQWDIKEAEFFKGQVRTRGHYDMMREQGKMLVLFNDMSLDELLAKAPSETEKEEMTPDKKPEAPSKQKKTGTYKGNVSGELQMDILHEWAGRPLHLNGQGNVKITEGELWNVPILSKLGKIIASASLGKVSSTLGQISEAEAKFDFNGVNVSVSQIHTNGTIISLNGNGEYRWIDDVNNGLLHFWINVVPVKDVKLLSFLLSPLTGMFQAELMGTLKENTWKIRTFIDKIF